LSDTSRKMMIEFILRNYINLTSNEKIQKAVNEMLAITYDLL